jgi:hypothetical protein
MYGDESSLPEHRDHLKSYEDAVEFAQGTYLLSNDDTDVLRNSGTLSIKGGKLIIIVAKDGIL